MAYHQLKIPKPLIRNMNKIKPLGFRITKNELLGTFIDPEKSFYDVKMLEQTLGSDYFLPTCSELGIAQKVLKFQINDSGALTDTLIAFPKQEWPQNFSRKVRNPELEDRNGKNAVLLENVRVTKEHEQYFLEGGRRTYVKKFPKTNEKLSSPIAELGLGDDKRIWADTDYSKEEGLRVVTRFNDGNIGAVTTPGESHNIGFYICKGKRPKTLDFYLGRILKTQPVAPVPLGPE